jgi:hypothetical protein
MLLRTIGIWGFGLLASCIIGGGLGYLIDIYQGSFLGMVAGVCTFACLRLGWANCRWERIKASES